MDMHIHADAGLSKSDGEHQVGALSSHAGQGQQLLKGLRHPSAEPTEEMLADLVNAQRLGPIKPNGVDEPGNLG